MARTLGLSTAAYSPLGGSLLSGRFADPDARAAIAWLLSRPDPIHPILGPRTDAQLADLLPAADTTLSPHALDRLEEASRLDPGYPADLIAQTLPRLDGNRDIHPG